MTRAARLLVVVGPVLVVLMAGDHHSRNRGPYEVSAWTWAYIGALIVGAYAVGLPDLTRTRRSALTASLGATVAAAAGVSIAQLTLGSLLLPRFVVFASAGSLIPWFLACTVVANGGRKQERFHDRILLVAGGDEAAALRQELSRQPEHFAHLAGVMSPSEAKAAHRGEEPMVDRAITLNVTVLVLDRLASADPGIVAQAATLHEAGVRIRTLALFYEEWLGKLPLSELERLSLMFDIGELHRARYGRVKRLFDVGVSLAGCVVLAALLPVLVVVNLVGNRGPLFYTQPRVGRDRSIFVILKLRSMRPDTGPSTWTTVVDDRVTPVGRWLRRLHLDELPQAVNMLRGDISLVGPRPEQPHYVEELAEKLPWYHVRHLVRPGLTGWAQVKYDYGASEHDALEKLQYELYYLRHQGFRLDLRIVGRTLRHLVRLGGR